MYIKVLTEMNEKKSRAELLKYIGMRRKERVQLLKHEIYFFYWLPGIITAVGTAIFTMATFHARMYSEIVIKEYLGNAAWIWFAYVMLQWLFTWYLSKFVVRKVEGKNE